MQKPNTVFDLWGPTRTKIDEPDRSANRQVRLMKLAESLKDPKRLRDTIEATKRKLGQQTSAKETKESVGKFIAQLLVKANERIPEALEILYFVARQSSAALMDHGVHDGPSLQRFACKQFGWPMLLWPYPAQQQMTLEAFHQLQAGSTIDSPIALQALFRVQSNYTAARAWVQRLVLDVHDVTRASQATGINVGISLSLSRFKIQLPQGCLVFPEDVVRCINLPPLTSAKKSQEAWLDFAMNTAKKASGGDITKHPQLASLGSNRANSHPKAFKSAGKTKQKRAGTWKSIAEDGIKKALKDALKSFSIK